MKHRWLIYIAWLCIAQAWAVPSTPYPIIRTLHDGRQVMLWLHGDEDGSYYTTENGTRVVITADARMQPDTLDIEQAANMKKANRQMRMPQETSQTSQFPNQGIIRSIVLLVNFADNQFSTNDPRSAFYCMLNQENYHENGGTGSARDYFIASSMGQFQPQFDVYGPYTLPHEMAYYGGNTKSGQDSKPRQMITDACDIALAQGVDFSLYDQDNNGIVDNVFVFYAGHNESEGASDDHIWPHRSKVSTNTKYSGKWLSDYACTGELRDYKGNNMCGIGTFCHEFGHVLGLPDTYATTNNNAENGQIYTVGTWDIMCSGSYCNLGRTPPVYNAWERFYLGWLTPVQLTEEGDYSLAPLETHGSAYLISGGTHNLQGANPAPSEYFLIENRQRIGWDSVYSASNSQLSTLPGHGLLISRITHNATRLTYNTFNDYEPYCYDILEAANPTPTQASAADTYPGSRSVLSFIPTFHNGTQLTEQRLTGINEWDDLSVSFHYGKNDYRSAITGTPDPMPVVLTEWVSAREQTYHIDTLAIEANLTNADTIRISTSNNSLNYSTDGGKTWLKGASQMAVATTPWHLDMLLRHDAGKQHCDTIVTLLRIEANNHKDVYQQAIQQAAPRKTFIHVPEGLRCDETSNNTIALSWDEVEDAESYYIRVYTKTGKDSVVTYLYDGNDYEVYANNSTLLSDLTTATAYYVQVRSYEAKGCTPHYSDWSAPLIVNTLSPSRNLRPNEMDVQLNYNGCPIALIVPYSYEAAEVYIYDIAGQLVAKLTVPSLTSYINIPADLLQSKHIYLLKYATNQRIGRNSGWAKITIL